MIEVYYYDKGLKTKKFHISDLIDLKKKKVNIWLDIIDPSLEELQTIGKVLSIHSLVIEDMFHTRSRAKMDQLVNYNFLVLYGVMRNKHVKMIKLDFLLGKNIVISSHSGNVGSFENLKKNKEKLSYLLKTGPDFILHTLIDHEIDNFFPILQQIDDELDTIENYVIEKSDPGILKKLFKLKRELLIIRKNTSPQREIIGLLAKRDFPYISREAEMFFRDVYDHIIRINESIDSYRDIISTTLEVHLSVISNRMNEIMKVLTVIATIMMPLSVIVGFFGMNYKYIPSLEWHNGYIFAFSLMLGVAFSLIIYFKRKNWA